MRRGGYAFFASRRCDIFTADLCNSIMPKTDTWWVAVPLSLLLQRARTPLELMPV